MIRIAIAGGTPDFRVSITEITAADPEIQVIGQWFELSSELANDSELDVLVMLANPDQVLDQSSVVGDFEQVSPGIATLMIGKVEAESLEQWTFRQYPFGILPEEFSPEELILAIKVLAQGLNVFPVGIIRKRKTIGVERNELPDTNENFLTEREIEVLRLLAEGLANKQIAERLTISPNTVKYHLASIYEKLDATNRAEAVTRGVQAGWLVL